MKKLLSVMVVVIITTGILLMNTEIILATNDIEITTSNTKNNTINQNVKENQVTKGEISKMKENAQQELDEYIELYGSESYGLTAFILKQVQKVAQGIIIEDPKLEKNAELKRLVDDKFNKRIEI